MGGGGGGGGCVVLGIIYSYCLLGDDGRLQELLFCMLKCMENKFVS